MMNALFTTLKWQLNDLSYKLGFIEQQIANLDQKIDLNIQKISSSCTIPALIFPEQEIARVNFLIQQQKQQDDLNKEKATLLSKQSTLASEQTRVNTKLKMLEKHQEIQLKKQHHQTLLAQQNNSDEWIIQRREHHGAAQ